jgi:hypothetical protein
VQRVLLRLYVMFAGERSEPSRGVDRLTVVVPDNTDSLPKSPGVEYTLLINVVFKS